MGYIVLFEVRKQMTTSRLNRYFQKFKCIVFLRHPILHLVLTEKFLVGCVFPLLPTCLGFMNYQNLSFG